MSAEQPAAPVLRIVRGSPEPEEVAALVTVLAAVSGGASAAPPSEPASHWAAPARLMRPAVAPTGWWASALPR